MAYERVWSFLPPYGPRISASVADAPAYCLWALKSFLKGEIGSATQGLWTCVGSSNGTVAALDGVDRWGTVYNIANIPYSDSATGTHAWIVLSRSYVVGGTPYVVYMLLSVHGYGLASGGLIATVIGTSAPAGGSITADPTFLSALQTHCTYASSANRYATDVANNRRYYGGLTSLGGFWFVETILGEIVRGFYFASPVGVKTNDQYPFYANICDTYSNNAVSGYAFHGGSLFVRSTSAVQGAGAGLAYNGATGYPFLNPPPDYSAVSLLDASDASLFDFPAYVLVGGATAANPVSIHARGRLPDTGLCSGTMSLTVTQMRPVNIGTAIRDINNNVIYVTAGALILPYNNTLS